MANKRLIYQDMFEDDTIGMMPAQVRLLWVGLITAVADDQGRLLDNTPLIKSKVFVYDADINCDLIDMWLEMLCKEGMIIRYEMDGKALIQIKNWWLYQTPSWASESKYEAPEGWIDRIKYHTKGNRIKSENWEKPGGYPIPSVVGLDPKPSVVGLDPIPSVVGLDSSELPSALDSVLPSAQVSGQDSSEDEEKDKRKDERKDEDDDDDEEKTTKDAAAIVLEKKCSEKVFRLYEEEIGQVTETIVRSITATAEQYPEKWICEAIQEAALAGVRKWSYVAAILKNWKLYGFKDKKNGNRKNLGDPRLDEFRREAMERRANVSEHNDIG